MFGICHCRAARLLASSRQILMVELLLMEFEKTLKKISVQWAFVGVVVAALSSCGGPSKAWNGNWRLNESQSSVPGPSLAIAVAPRGRFHVTHGILNYSFACDGRVYPMAADRSISCRQLNKSAIETTMREKGNNMGTSRWELVSGGGMLKITLTSLDVHGLTSSQEHVYVRASGSSGFSGSWNDAKPFETQPQLLELRLTGRRLHYAFPELGQVRDLTLDGSDAAIHGPGVPPGSSMAIEQIDPTEFSMTKRLSGEVLNVGSLKISKNGHTLVETYWRPERPDERAAMVYDKQ